MAGVNAYTTAVIKRSCGWRTYWLRPLLLSVALASLVVAQCAAAPAAARQVQDQPASPLAQHAPSQSQLGSLWGFAANRDGNGPAVRVPPARAAWTSSVEDAARHAAHGRLNWAAWSYATALRSFSMPPADEHSVRLALGRCLLRLGLAAEAQSQFEAAAPLRPLSPSRVAACHYWNGVALTLRGMLDSAIEEYERALFFDPAMLAAVHNLGSLLIVKGQVDDGIHFYASALRTAEDVAKESDASDRGTPDIPDLGASPAPASIQTSESIGWQAPKLDRDDAALAQADLLGISLDAVLPTMQELLLAALGDPEMMLMAPDGQRRAAMDALSIRAALRLFVNQHHSLDFALWHRQLGYSLLDIGVFDEAILQFQLSAELSGPAACWVNVYVVLVVPQVATSQAALCSETERLLEDATRAAAGPRVHCNVEHFKDHYHTTYLLPFMGVRDLRVNNAVSSLLRASALQASLVADETMREVFGLEDADHSGVGVDGLASSFVKPSRSALSRPFPSTQREGNVIRVGFLGYRMYNTTEGNWVHSLVSSWPSAPYGETRRPARRIRFPTASRRVAKFRTTIFLPRPFGDNTTRDILAKSHRLIKLEASPRNLSSWKHDIASEELDVLVIMHDGLDAYISMLLDVRLAPVQVLVWGDGLSHVGTAGVGGAMDYIVAGDRQAAPRLGADVGEQLVRLECLGLGFSAPRQPPAATVNQLVSRLALLESNRMYLVPAVLRHLHPAFDEVIAGVLSGDKAAIVVAFRDHGDDLWLERTLERLRISVGSSFVANHRIRFVPAVEAAELSALLVTADAVLDTFPVGVGAAGLRALSLGCPVITLRPDSTVGAETCNSVGVDSTPWLQTVPVVLELMGIPELIAQSPLEMATLAVTTTMGPGYSDLRERLRSSAAALDWRGVGPVAAKCVEDWEQFIGRAGAPWAHRRRWRKVARAREAQTASQEHNVIENRIA